MTVLYKPTFAYTADLHGAVPLSILTRQVGVVSTQSKAVITDKLNYRAVGKQSTRGRMAGVSPILRFRERQTCWWRKSPSRQVSIQVSINFITLEMRKRKWWNTRLTTTTYALRGFGGPPSYCGASEDAGSVWQIAGVTAVLQNCTHREQAPVGVCEVYPAVLDHVWPHTSWEKRPRDRGVGNHWKCSKSFNEKIK